MSGTKRVLASLAATTTMTWMPRHLLPGVWTCSNLMAATLTHWTCWQKVGMGSMQLFPRVGIFCRQQQF